MERNTRATFYDIYVYVYVMILDNLSNVPPGCGRCFEGKCLASVGTHKFIFQAKCPFQLSIFYDFQVYRRNTLASNTISILVYALLYPVTCYKCSLGREF